MQPPLLLRSALSLASEHRARRCGVLGAALRDPVKSSVTKLGYIGCFQICGLGD